MDATSIFGLLTGALSLLSLFFVRLHLPAARMEALATALASAEAELQSMSEDGIDLGEENIKGQLAA